MQQFFIGVKAIIEHDGKILLIKRSDKYKGISGIWDIPGGRLEFGEEPEDGLRREVMEETGIKLTGINRILDASTVYNDDEKHIVRITYLCTAEVKEMKLSNEHTEFIWVDPKKIDFKIEDRLLEKALSLI
jgi:8-oxo-dGTP diphosphatase